MPDVSPFDAFMNLKMSMFREFQLYIGGKLATWRNSAARTKDASSSSDIRSGDRDI
jgi:hypothetical protein